MDNKENRTTASEIIAEQEKRMRAVLCELDCLDCDFDKAAFVLGEVGELIDMREPETMEDALRIHLKQKDIANFVAIAFDYVKKAQSTISDIIIRERRRYKASEAEEGAVDDGRIG